MGRHCVLLLATCVAASLLSCGKKDSEPNGQSRTPGGSSPTLPGLTLPAGLARLTPEQISTVLERALDYRLTWSNGVETFDLITDYLGIPLGGVDFRNASVRDPLPKVQTLLVVRSLALAAAFEVVFREVKLLSSGSGANATHVRHFLQCNVLEDRPVFPEEMALPQGQLAARLQADERWKAQVQYFYWRLLSRPPNEAELAIVRQRFLGQLRAAPYPPAAWAATLTAMLSTMEFWHTTL